MVISHKKKKRKKKKDKDNLTCHTQLGSLLDVFFSLKLFSSASGAALDLTFQEVLGIKSKFVVIGLEGAFRMS